MDARAQRNIQPCLIGGAWVEGERTVAVENPATGEIMGYVPGLGAAEAQAAVDAAEKALSAWAGRTAAARADILMAFYHGLAAKQDEVAVILSSEQGKPFAEARGEVAYANGFIRWFAEEARRSYGETIPSPSSDQRIVVIRQPVGVVAAITPWNFPAAMVTRKIAPALAAGCTVVLKPAEQTPLTALAIARIGMDAGLPAGVLNVVTGKSREIGPIWTASPVVRKLSFTGSTEVGALLYAQCAPTIKKLSLELGGNAPFIVFDDADIDAAVKGAMASKYRNSGQTCVCANRFYVQAGIHDAFVEGFAAAAAALRVGPASDLRSEIGPLIDEPALEKVSALVSEAVAGGAQIVTGGQRDGRYYRPTVLTNVTVDMRLAQEEIFGPVAPIIRFEADEDVVRMANDTPFGLAAYFYTRDVGRIWRVAEATEAGIVGVNTGLISTEVAPFGGIKSSGLGREGSRHGLDDYQELKYVCLGL